MFPQIPLTRRDRRQPRQCSSVFTNGAETFRQKNHRPRFGNSCLKLSRRDCQNRPTAAAEQQEQAPISTTKVVQRDHLAICQQRHVWSPKGTEVGRLSSFKKPKPAKLSQKWTAVPSDFTKKSGLSREETKGILSVIGQKPRNRLELPVPPFPRFQCCDCHCQKNPRLCAKNFEKNGFSLLHPCTPLKPYCH